MSIIAPDGSVWPEGSLRALEHSSIRAFVALAAADGYLKGRVLDYGCGYAPYREIIEQSGGEWFGYDRHGLPDNHVGDIGFTPSGRFHAVLCTQVIQYDFHPWRFLRDLRNLLRDGGYLVLTYPTTWPEVQKEDMLRFTAAGIERCLSNLGFEIVLHASRGSVTALGEKFSLGGGVVCRLS